MANFNTLIKRKQYLAGTHSGRAARQPSGGLYLSDLNLSSDEEPLLRANPHRI
jgi:hypothetical protein